MVYVAFAGDSEVAKAFVGENPEIMGNQLYHNQKISTSD